MQIVESVLPALDGLEVDLDVSMKDRVLTVKNGAFTADGLQLELGDDYEVDCSADADHIVFLARNIETKEVDVLVDVVRPGHMPIGSIVIGDFRRLFVLAQVSVRGDDVTLVVNRRKKQKQEE
jgi:hypothetical protein